MNVAQQLTLDIEVRQVVAFIVVPVIELNLTIIEVTVTWSFSGHGWSTKISDTVIEGFDTAIAVFDRVEAMHETACAQAGIGHQRVHWVEQKPTVYVGETYRINAAAAAAPHQNVPTAKAPCHGRQSRVGRSRMSEN
jgi:hypothetical protein